MKITFFNVPTSGHVNPSLALAQALVARGHDVNYYLTPGYREAVEATGATYRAYDAVDDDYFDDLTKRFNPPRLAYQLLASSYEMVGRLAAMLRAEDQEVVVYDSMCPWGWLAARAAGLPAVASMSLLDLPPSYLLRSGQGAAITGLLVRNWRWFGRYARTAWRMRQELGIMPPPPLAILNRPGDLSIWYTSSLLPADGDAYDDSYVFVGPPVAARQETADFPWSWLEEGRPLVYVSLGTVFNDNLAFFRVCLEAFAGQGVQAVLSLGRRLPVDRLGPLPPNVLARSYVPQVALLPHVELFVTHAGVNSVHEGLYFGVPLLLVPQQAEQAMVAVRIEELGAGLTVRADEIGTNMVWDKASRLLTEPAFRQRAERLGQSLREAGGSARGVAAIEAWYAARQDAKDSSPAARDAL